MGRRGAWLRAGDADVDWIYRDLARVRLAWADAQAGRFGFHTQVGPPLGFADFVHAGEAALGIVLAGPSDELTPPERRARLSVGAGSALVDGLWDADFLVANAAKAVTRADSALVAG